MNAKLCRLGSRLPPRAPPADWQGTMAAPAPPPPPPAMPHVLYVAHYGQRPGVKLAGNNNSDNSLMDSYMPVA